MMMLQSGKEEQNKVLEFAFCQLMHFPMKIKKMSLCSQEFEVLAQIRLLQSSCKNCTFTVDEAFICWYQSVPTLTEEER